MKIPCILLCLLTAPVWATGLQADGSDKPVQLYAVDYELEVHDVYVAGLLELQFIAAYGDDNAANLRFPLPPGAVLHKAEIFLPAREQWMAAETLGRREGQQVYEEATRTNTDPLLIQRIGSDFYRARVFPVSADGDLRLRVHYAHTLETADNGYRLRVAFANPDASAATPARGVSVALRTDSGDWQDGAWQTTDALGHYTTLSGGQERLELSDFTLDRDLLLPLTPAAGTTPAATLSYQPRDSDLDTHNHSWWQPDFSAFPALMSQPRNVVFVIDVSGSMSGAKIAQAKQALLRTLELLDEADYFGLVAFDSQVYVFDEQMRSGADLEAAKQWVAGLRAGSSTGMSAGLQRAAEVGVTSLLINAEVDLFLMTDGRPNEGSDTVMDILADIGTRAEQLGRRIRVFSVGIGYNLDQALLNGLAQQSNGESTFALDDGEITGQVLDLFSRIRGGGLSNVELFADATAVNHWARVFPGTTLSTGIIGALPDELSLNGTAPDLTPLQLTLSLPAPPDVPETFRRIAAPLAAKALADRLERQIDSEGESDELVTEAVRLARTYGIVTRYSSLLALESEADYAEYGVERIERDPAGIALQPVTDVSSDENRVGGAGTDDAGITNSAPPPVYAGAIAPTGGSIMSPAPLPAMDYAYEYDEPVVCDNGLLDQQLRLYLPAVDFLGNRYWASFRYVGPEAIFELVTYGLPDASYQYDGCPPAQLTPELRLSVPAVMYDVAGADRTFSNVELVPVPGSGFLRFRVVRVR